MGGFFFQCQRTSSQKFWVTCDRSSLGSHRTAERTFLPFWMDVLPEEMMWCWRTGSLFLSLLIFHGPSSFVGILMSYASMRWPTGKMKKIGYFQRSTLGLYSLNNLSNSPNASDPEAWSSWLCYPQVLTLVVGHIQQSFNYNVPSNEVAASSVDLRIYPFWTHRNKLCMSLACLSGDRV